MIILYQRILAHYRLPLFQRLHETLPDGLQVCYGALPGATIPQPVDGVGFGQTPVRNRWWFGQRLIWQPYGEPLREHPTPRAVVIEHNPRILSVYSLMAYCRRRAIPIVLWGHGGSMIQSRSIGRRIKDKVHAGLIRQADAYVCYTDHSKETLSKLISADNVFVAQNTLDTPTLFAIRLQLERETRERIKRRFDLAHRYYLCFIGALEQRKNPFLVLDLIRRLRDENLDVGALIIGDGPLLTPLRQRAEQLGLSDVRFTGEITAFEESAPLLFISDAMIIPDEMGLAINQGLSLGVPLITQQPPDVGRQHGPEIDYLIEGKTGFQVPRGDMTAWTDRVRQVIDNRQAFNDAAIDFAEQQLRPERWVAGMVAAIDHAVAARQGAHRHCHIDREARA